MALFQHALQLCTIAYISNAVQGHVLFAVNVEDFRNLANQFLSRTLGEKLKQLVSQSAGTNRRDDTRTGQTPDIDLSKVAEIIRDKFVNEYNSHVPSTKGTRKYNIKRFNTVKNTDEVTEGQTIDKEMLRNPNNQDDPGPVYVKDDLDKLLQNNNDGQSNDHLQYAKRPNESKEKIISQEPIYSKGSFDAMRNKHAQNQSDTHKMIDYTETKLGEWLFNHIISQKPLKIQNHKNDNIDIKDINEDGNADENVRNVQYVYETHLSGAHDKSKQNVRHEALPPKNKETDNVNIRDQQIGEQSINEYIMVPKLNTFYKKKPQRQKEEDYTSSKYRDEVNENDQLMDTQHEKPIQGNKNIFNHGSIHYDQVKVMPASLEETKTEPIKAEMETLYDTTEGIEGRIEEHIMFNKYILGLKDKENRIKDPQRPPVGENNMEENYEQGQQTKSRNKNGVNPQKVEDSDEKLIKETKHIIFSDENMAYNKDELDESHNRDQSLLRDKKGDPDIKISKKHHYPSDYKEVKSDSVKSKTESSLDDTVEVKDQKGGTHITSKKENYIHRKKPQIPLIEENDVYDKYALGSETKNNNRGKDKPEADDDYVYKRTIAGKHRFDDDVFNKKDDETFNTGQSILRSTKRGREVSKYGVFTSKAPRKEEKFDKDLLPDFQSAKLSSSSSEKIIDKQVERDKLNKYNLGKDTYKEKSKKQPMEENDMYEKYSLGSKDSKGREVKKDDDKYGYKDTNLGKKNEGNHRFRDKDMENDMYEKVSLGSRDRNGKGRVVKKNDDKYEYKDTNLGKKNEGNHRIRDKDMENDMYEKHSLGSRNKNSKGRDVKKDNDKYGYKDTNLGKKNEVNHRIRDKDMENDMYEKHSLGSRDKNSKGREVKKENDKYGYKDTNFGKKNEGNHRIRDDDEKNDMYGNHLAGSKNKNSKRREVKQKGEENDKYEKSFLGLKDKKSNREFIKDGDNYRYEDTVLGKKNKDHHIRDEDEELDMNYKQSQGSKDKNSKGREVKKDYDKYGYKESVLGKKNEADHRLRDKNEENDMYDREVKKDDDRYGYKDTVLGKKNKDHRGVNKDEENDMYEKYSLVTKDKNSNKEIRKENDRYGHKKSVSGKNNEDKYEENDMYDKYQLGSKVKSIKDKKVNKDDYGYKETGLGKKKVDNRGLNKDNSENNDELLLKNKNRHLLKDTKEKGPKNDEVPSAGYAGDPRPDFVEVKPESIKAKTESLLDSVEDKGKATKHYTMKGTNIPKREFYKLSSPNYLKDLPRVVDKYNFEEPLPELDRERDKVAYLKREPARVNKKLKLPVFEKVK